MPQLLYQRLVRTNFRLLILIQGHHIRMDPEKKIAKSESICFPECSSVRLENIEEERAAATPARNFVVVSARSISPTGLENNRSEFNTETVQPIISLHSQSNHQKIITEGTHAALQSVYQPGREKMFWITSIYARELATTSGRRRTKNDTRRYKFEHELTHWRSAKNSKCTFLRYEIHKRYFFRKALKKRSTIGM